MHAPRTYCNKAGDHGAAAGRGRTTRKANGPQIPLFEWIVAAVGFVLVFGTAAFIVISGYTRGNAPPDITVRPETVARVQGGYVVTLRAKNAGDSTAADVKIEGTLKAQNRVVETSEMGFQYLPPGSERRGGMFFRNDPRAHELALTPKGYEAP